MPLTVFKLKNQNKLMPKIVTSGKIYYTPWVDLDNFRGNILTKIFFVTDLAGFYGKVANYSESVSEKKYIVFHGKYSLLQEFVTLPALMDKQADLTSDLTNNFKTIRKDIQKTANINTKLITTELEGTNVIFKFLTEATEMYPKDHVFKEVDPETKDFKNNPSKTYEIWLKLLDVVGEKGWLGAFDLEKETLSQDDIKDILKVSNVQLWNSSPSWHWQGFNWWNSQIDSSVFPTNIQPKFWHTKHGDGVAFFDKHVSQLVDQLPFFMPQMASSLTNLLRQKGFIPKYKRKKI